ncbi:GAF domain-containing sensor histidine kinase [Zunongwangia sp. HGR-M22]|uniref:GAF domain-containing sensor histidine kinase n=1 Tax=Zunongwangia sp. HGR-M22 TaxID=3015168 RepID=UPI0022DDC847|nr:GAF domain-containing sensor histidine kinase [Zunongwangia sp. HGR-M22]WBL25809.1 GAF domain-containing sensor histidine kinase [Zunongwangia sp. HGR-M22]
MNEELALNFKKDIEDVNEIPGIHSLLNVISSTSKMRFVAVARVTENRWITAVSKDDIEFGLRPGDELDVGSTICNEIREHHIPVIINDVDNNFIFKDHHTPKQYGFKSYISYPIFLRDGSFFGTLCAIDPNPANLNNDQIKGMFEQYVELISFHLESVQKLQNANKQLQKQQEIAELRETFIAILGHDLRNPVGTARICADMLLSANLPEASKKQAEIIKSTSYRMQSLIDNLLDFAKGNLGDGINLNRSNNSTKLEKEIREVVEEFRALNKENKITTAISVTETVNCDSSRVSQLLSNLLSNATKHGTLEEPIEVIVSNTENEFSLSVINQGKTIPEDYRGDLFKPFFKSKAQSNENGLGLGLYIASEIAKAHDGSLAMTSENGETSFTFKMPLTQSVESKIA